MDAGAEYDRARRERETQEERAEAQRQELYDRRRLSGQRALAVEDTRSAERRHFHNQRRLAEQEYQRRIAEEEARRVQYQEYHRAEEERLRQERVVEPPPLTAAMIFSYRWFRNRIRNFWQESPPGILAVALLAGFATTWVTISYAYQLLFGWIFYVYAYYQAYNGYDLIINGCSRAMRDGRSFWAWGGDHQSWFHLQRCRAYEAGLDRDGQLSPFSQAVAVLVTDPFAASPFVYFSAMLFVFWFLLRPVGRKLSAFSRYALHAKGPFWGKMIYACLFTGLVFLMANDRTYLAILVGVGFTSIITIYVVVDAFVFSRFKPAWDAASANLFAGPIIAVFTWLWRCILDHFSKFPKNLLGSAPMHICTHVNPCHCYTEKDRRMAKLSDDNAALQTQLWEAQESLQNGKRLLDVANTNLGLVTAERDRCEARNNGGLPSPGHWHNSRFKDARSKHWEEMFMQRDSEYVKLLSEKDEQERQYRRELGRLQKSVDYTSGAGLDREIALKELYEARGTIRKLERERNELSLAGMALRQELAKEKESHSEKCQNEASCQKRIQELEENYDRIIAHMREDQFLVTDACIKLGMDPKEAQHVQLRAYLSEVTIKLAQLYALGICGADTTDLQVDIMRKEVAREATYKNRLEREVERLGGNIIDIRIGLDTTRPQDWKIDFMTYEQNHLRVFPIYQRLWQAIVVMNEIYTREGFVLPPWYHQPVRNDKSSHMLALPPAEAGMQLIKSNELTNPHIQNLEMLVEKLVVSECQRLYNRGLQLFSFLDNNMTVHADDPNIQGVNAILNEVLHEVLDFIPALLPNHPTERRLSRRKQKKFEIYSAMQYSIAGLNLQIIANKRMPPDWLPTDHLDELFSKPYDSPENLAMNLSNHELSILAKRIQQLVACTEEYHLPGTKAGPPRVRLQHDDKYEQRWKDLVIARTFAEITISHWNVHKSQKELLVTDEAGRQLVRFEPNPQLLPLDVEKFRKAVGLAPFMTEDKRWPDEWKAKIINDPSSGPVIIFEPPGPSDLTPKAIEDGTGVKSIDYTPEAITGTPKDTERKRLQNEWKENQERCEQLYNHVTAYGIKGHIPRLNTINLRVNADPKTMKREIENFKEAQNQYVHALTGGRDKHPVPPMRKKGGKMDPFS
ncbi:hypothetical protein BKA65DRAFT_272485 [Rhexocercosporidium sp. MPI-PUGE-AT-0058]|nr:hypothetical protein BKA65DRAFT_272485 [Rhexocercosporidium sp. MPI-PUGE-AT-0058]